MRIDLCTCNPVDAVTMLFNSVDHTVREFIMPIAIAGDPQRTGGWFALWRNDPNIDVAIPVAGFAIGAVSPERFLRYQFFANEKAQRLSTHITDISSWQSRDASNPDYMKNKYGGAIRCDNNIFFSFSGFTEHEDEIICTITARQLGLISSRKVNCIIEFSGNSILASYRDSRPHDLGL